MHQMVAAWLKTHHLPLAEPLTREGLCMGFVGVAAGVSVPSLTNKSAHALHSERQLCCGSPQHCLMLTVHVVEDPSYARLTFS